MKNFVPKTSTRVRAWEGDGLVGDGAWSWVIILSYSNVQPDKLIVLAVQAESN